MCAIVVQKQYLEYFESPAGVVQGAIDSVLAAGSVVGSAVAGPLSDNLGRRDAVAVACIFWLIGTSVQVPVYLAEIAKREQRDSNVITQQLAIEFGILVMYFIGYGRGNLAGPASFRTARGTQFIPAFFLLAGFPFLPRSPRWLAKVGREKEVIETLANIQAAGNTEDPLVIAEWGEIVTVMRAEEEAGPGWRKFFRDGMWMRTMAGMSVQAWQQLAGANVIVYYLTYIAGLRGNAAMVTSGVQYAVFIIFTGVMWIFTDRTFRRGLLILGAIGMGFCHFVVVGTMGMHSVQVPDGVDGNLNIIFKVNPGAPANTVIVFSYLLIVVYALTLAPVCWIYAAEVWSLGTRATGMSMAAMSNWVFNFALGVFTPPAFINIEWKPFIIFGALCLTAVAWFFVFFPETCGKTLEEVELMFSKNDPKPWNTRKGESRLEAGIEAVIARKLGGND